MDILPRFGIRLFLQKALEKVTYLGMGPYESYSDLHCGSYVGLFETSAEDSYVDYIRPQEHGNHYGVKYLQIGKLVFTAAQGMEINVSRYSTDAISRAEHTDELVADGRIHLRLDYKVSGIGSNSCGPALAQAYRLEEKKISFQFQMRPAINK